MHKLADYKPSELRSPSPPKADNQSFDSNGVQFAWDATSIFAAETCLRKYQYEIIDGWRPRHESVHLTFGRLYASALEFYHKTRANEADHNEALIQTVHSALTASFDWESDDPNKNRYTLIRTIVWYLEEYKDDPAVTVQTDEGPAVEHSFALDLDNGLVLTGHIDRLVKIDNDCYVTDNKTTKYTITPRYWDQFSPHTQMYTYTFAGKIIYDLPVKGVIIDAAQIAVGFSRFARGFTFRTETQLSEWYDDSMYHITSAREATMKGYFPQNRASCSNYGGCAFRGVCARSPEVRKNFLAADFIQDRNWDPLEKR